MTAIDFPDSPTDGQDFDLWRWDNTRSVWDWNVVPGPSNEVEALVLAGGGGGGRDIAGGGGGGGYQTDTLTLAAGAYTVTVGAGGTGGIQALELAEMVKTRY